jgi:hypothetical protein
MKTIVIVYYKIVKKTIDILHNETIWVKWEFFVKKPHSGLFQAICEIARTIFRPWLSPESGYNYQESLDRLTEVLFLMILMHAWY